MAFIKKNRTCLSGRQAANLISLIARHNLKPGKKDILTEVWPQNLQLCYGIAYVIIFIRHNSWVKLF
jgi:hypothetical protein